MLLITALRTGAALGAVVGLLAAAGEVVGLATDLISACQRGGALALALYALPLFVMIGLGSGAILGGALWLAGVRTPLRPLMDAQIGRLVDALTRLGVLDRSILVLTADHSESFGEHRLLTHGNALCEDRLGIPLIPRLPGQVPARTVIPTPVQTLDVFPRCWTSSGSSRRWSCPGRVSSPCSPRGPRAGSARWWPSSAGRKCGAASVLASTVTSSRCGRARGNTSPPSVGAELYNLADDPAELDNRARAEPERVSQFQREALRWMTSHARRGPRRAIDRATGEQLKALGY